MKHATLLTLLVLTFSMTALVGQTKKYDIKSAVITFEMTMKASGFEQKTKVVVYFDDYGMKECRDTYEDNKLKESFFSDGKDLYKVIYDQKAAYKSGAAYRGTELKFDWDEISAKDKKDGKAKKLPNTTVAGKLCESYEYTTRGTTSKFAGWNHILLMSDVSTKDISSVTNAVKIDEQAKVPPEKFKIPKGFELKQSAY